MKMKNRKLYNRNKIIIIGGNHFNTIGLIRSFGVNGLKPYLILVSKKRENNYCAKTKFICGVVIVNNYEDVLDILRKGFQNEPVRPVLVPSSDAAIFLIDSNHDELSNRYILPSINNKQGEIARLMNKAEQADWAKSLGIKTAQTHLIIFDQEIDYNQLPIPCIVKPVLSHEGAKKDIRKCNTIEELKGYIDILKENGYYRILLQEFLNKDYEMELFGTIMEHQEVIPYILTKHVREWPIVGGSVCCHEFILDEYYHNQARDILKKIKEYGYVGNFDIEIINVGGDIYLNEINFRNSGDVYACFHNKIFYSYYGYLDMIGVQNKNINTKYSNKYYAMCEDRDLMWVKNGLLSFTKWLRFLIKTRDFAYFSIGDLRPSLAYYKVYFRNMIKNKR